jgi:uncharacterized protein YutE (UPF0331/DUF86 family)
MQDEKQTLLLKQLQINTDALNKAAEYLQYSQQKCTANLKPTKYTASELESCEALAARFARAADILTQKVLKNIFAILQENPLTFIDKCNLAEKFGIIESADELIKIRGLRNDIAHEYSIVNIDELFVTIFEYTVKLLAIIKKVNNYTAKLI